MSADIHWTHARFDELDARAVHDFLRLRVEVFVVEQACAYPEIDGLDVHEATRHLIGRADDETVVYGRSLVAGGDEPVRLGRIVVAERWRGRGVARELVRRLLDDVAERHPGRDVVLGAQVVAEGLYAGLGFVRSSDEYLEDGIPHVDMRLTRG